MVYWIATWIKMAGRHLQSLLTLRNALATSEFSRLWWDCYSHQNMDPRIHQLLKTGTVIPAHPLALNASRRLDERRQRALSRYYVAAGLVGWLLEYTQPNLRFENPRWIVRAVFEFGRRGNGPRGQDSRRSASASRWDLRKDRTGGR